MISAWALFRLDKSAALEEGQVHKSITLLFAAAATITFFVILAMSAGADLVGPGF
jgi:hypothetical protein